MKVPAHLYFRPLSARRHPVRKGRSRTLYFFIHTFFHTLIQGLNHSPMKVPLRFAFTPGAHSAQIGETISFCLASMVKCTCSRCEFWGKSSIFVLLLYNKGSIATYGPSRAVIRAAQVVCLMLEDTVD